MSLYLYISVALRKPEEDSIFFFMTFLLALVWPLVPVILFVKVVNERI